jgi:hypothetical protein
MAIFCDGIGQRLRLTVYQGANVRPDRRDDHGKT